MLKNDRSISGMNKLEITDSEIRLNGIHLGYPFTCWQVEDSLGLPSRERKGANNRIMYDDDGMDFLFNDRGVGSDITVNFTPGKENYEPTSPFSGALYIRGVLIQSYDDFDRLVTDPERDREWENIAESVELSLSTIICKMHLVGGTRDIKEITVYYKTPENKNTRMNESERLQIETQARLAIARLFECTAELRTFPVDVAGAKPEFDIYAPGKVIGVVSTGSTSPQAFSTIKEDPRPCVNCSRVRPRSTLG